MAIVITTKTFVEFLEPGSFYPEEYTQEVQSRDPLLVQPGQNVFAFSFYDITYVEIDGKRYVGAVENRSPLYYVGGKLYEGDEIPEEGFLRQNAQTNGWKHLIRCRTGNWRPFTDNDVLLPDPTDARPAGETGGER